MPNALMRRRTTLNPTGTSAVTTPPTAPTSPVMAGPVEGATGEAGEAVGGAGVEASGVHAEAKEEQEDEAEGEGDGEGGLQPIVDATTLIAVPRTVSEGPKGGPWSNTQRSMVRAHVPTLTLANHPFAA